MRAPKALRPSRLGRVLAVGLAVAATSATGLVAASAPSSEAATNTPVLDNQLCIRVAGTGFHSPIDQIILQNAIQTIDFQPGVLGRTVQCNPVSLKVYRFGHVRTSWKTNPKAHPLCWALSYTWKPYKVQITNEFGTAVMSTGSPSSVCLPTWAGTKGPLKNGEVAPPGLDYFTCYPLSAISGDPTFTPSSSVKLQLASGGLFYKVRVRSATQLCLPSTLIDNNVQYNTQTSSDASMTCFGIAAKLTIPKRYYNLDVFGSGISSTKGLSGLCLPSTIQIDGPGS